MKKTAVEWLIEDLTRLGHNFKLYKKEIEQAKEMEKKQKYTEEDMTKCWNTAYTDAMDIDSETYKPIFYSDFINSLNKQDK